VKKGEKKKGVRRRYFSFLDCACILNEGHGGDKKVHDLLSAIGIRLESTLPDAEGHLDTTIISKVLSECQLSVDVVVFVIRSLDSKVTVLLDKALGFLLESLYSRVCPPLLSM
jgi:hypothetical protein